MQDPHLTVPIKAMILAAGRGERMRPLTDSCPKPLLRVRGKALLDWQVEALVRGGFRELVINTAWLGKQISSHFGLLDKQDGRGLLLISYSHEGADFGGALETAGGIARALPLLGDVFWVLAGDVFVPGFEFTPAAVGRFTASGRLAHLWLVPNPAHNRRGDFGLAADGQALNLAPDDAAPRYTYTGEESVNVMRKALENVKPSIEVRSRRVGGATYQVPVDVRPTRRLTLAMRWLVQYSRARGEKDFSKKLAAELFDAYNNRGNSIKKKEDVHKMAESNKAFAHYNW